MDIEVDSSGLWTKVQEPSVFALAGQGFSYAIQIPPDVKRACIEAIRTRKGRRENIHDLVRLYTACLFLLLQGFFEKASEVVLDEELPKHMGEVRALLLRWVAERLGPGPARTPIRIRRIGKKSEAHRRANAVYRGREEADRVVHAEEILEFL